MLQYFLSSIFLLQLIFWVWPLQHTEQTSSLNCPCWCLNLFVERSQLIQNPSVYMSSLNHAFQGALLCTHLHCIPFADALLSNLILSRLTKAPHQPRLAHCSYGSSFSSRASVSTLNNATVCIEPRGTPLLKCCEENQAIIPALPLCAIP